MLETTRGQIYVLTLSVQMLPLLSVHATVRYGLYPKTDLIIKDAKTLAAFLFIGIL